MFLIVPVNLIGLKDFNIKNLTISKQLAAYWFVFILGLIAIAAKYKYNGLVFGFDYGIYQPDGKYYTYMTLDFINNDPKQSAQSVVNWYASHGYKGNIFQISDLIPETSPVYHFISHRVLYSLLSIPFVYVFGIPGMIVVPAISFLCLLLFVQKISNNYNLIHVGVCVCIILSTSPTVIRWMIWNGTDALLTGLFSYVALLLYKLHEKSDQKYFQLFLLILLTAATRFSLVFWVAIAFVIYFKRKKFLALMIVSISSLCSLPALFSTLGVSILPAEKSQSTLEKISNIPLSFLKVVSIDTAQLAVLDRLLLIYLVAGLLFSILYFRSVASQYFIAVLLAGYLLGAVNGTLGVNFRYQLPAIPFCAWSIIASWPLIQNRLKTCSFLRPHIKV
jgi:hypothetical protein